MPKPARLMNALRMRRREFVIGAMIAPLAQRWRSNAVAGEAAGNGPPRGDVASQLRTVRHWGCQYQNIDPAEIARSKLELVVVDHALGEAGTTIATPSAVQRLKQLPDGRRRLVLAYLSVGEAETYRTYWKDEWNTTPPVWLGKANPDWPGAVGVRFWSDPWKELTYAGSRSLLEKIIDAGFDGVFLDRVDAYVEWAAERPAAGLDMIALVKELRAKARRRNQHFLVVAQNAEDLLKIVEYRSSIDGVAKESLFYGLKQPGAANGPADVSWSLSRLRIAQKAGLPIFAIEYLQDADTIAQAKARLDKEGFVAFFANRALDKNPDPT